MGENILARTRQNKKTKKVMYSGLQQKIILIYGTNNTGKTNEVCKLDPDHTLLLATEKGYNAVALPYDPIDIANAKVFKDVVRELVDPKKLQENLEDFHIVAIDSIDKINDLFTSYICKRENVNKIGDIPYGGGYGMVRMEIADCINALTLAGYCVIFIDHDDTDAEYVDPVTGETYPYTFPKGTMSKSGAIFRDLADFTIYLQNNGTDENGDVILSDGITAHRKNVFARSRFTKTASKISPFTAENLVKFIKDAVYNEAQKLGADVVDNFDIKSVVKTEDELKAEKKNTKETLIADIKKYGRTLNKDFASECNEVMTKYGFGKGQTRLDDASDGQIQHLDNILEALKDIAYRNKIDVE